MSDDCAAIAEYLLKIMLYKIEHALFACWHALFACWHANSACSVLYSVDQAVTKDNADLNLPLFWVQPIYQRWKAVGIDEICATIANRPLGTGENGTRVELALHHRHNTEYWCHLQWSLSSQCLCKHLSIDYIILLSRHSTVTAVV